MIGLSSLCLEKMVRDKTRQNKKRAIAFSAIVRRPALRKKVLLHEAKLSKG